MKARATSRFSSDIAHAVSRGVGEGAGAELHAQETAERLAVRKTLFYDPHARRDGRHPRGIARESSNAAARIAAIKALREIGDGAEPEGRFAELDQIRKTVYGRPLPALRREDDLGRRERRAARPSARIKTRCSMSPSASTASGR